MRLTKSAVLTVALVSVPASLVAALFAGSHGLFSVVVAVGIVIGNAFAAAGLSAMAGRISRTGAAMIALPSFALRMTAIVVLLELVKLHGFVIPALFAASFGTAVALVLVIEARNYRRTPWLALTFGPKEEV